MQQSSAFFVVLLFGFVFLSCREGITVRSRLRTAAGPRENKHGRAHAQIAVIDKSARFVNEGIASIAIIMVREPWKVVAVVWACFFTAYSDIWLGSSLSCRLLAVGARTEAP